MNNSGSIKIDDFQEASQQSALIKKLKQLNLKFCKLSVKNICEKDIKFGCNLIFEITIRYCNI